MAYKISHKASVERDLKKLSKPEATRVLDKLEQELCKNSEKGEPQKGTFQGLYRLRVGDYRVIYTKIVDGVLVLRIAHRKDVYR